MAKVNFDGGRGYIEEGLGPGISRPDYVWMPREPFR